MKNKLTLKTVYDRTYPDLIDQLSDLQTDGDIYHSPDILELIVWNIVIAFAVNVAASATYESLSQLLKKNKPITRRDLEENKNIIENQEFTMEITKKGNAKTSVKRIVNGYFRAEVSDHLAEKIIDELLKSSSKEDKK